jgi:hypothetical protein
MLQRETLQSPFSKGALAQFREEPAVHQLFDAGINDLSYHRIDKTLIFHAGFPPRVDN